MRIVVVGAGKVGRTIAEHLTQEEHEVVVIDKDEVALHRCEDTLDVMCVEGSGANAKTLVEAQVDTADILIAATASDEVNMLCSLMGKRLGAKYTIARIRDPEYNESLSLLQTELGIDLSINPERASAQEISRLLRFPFASDIESFAKGQVEMVLFRVAPQEKIAGIPLWQLAQSLPDMPRVLFAAAEREGEIFIPGGDFVFQPGDHVYVTGDVMSVTRFFRFLGKNTAKSRRVMIVGGGRISYYLARLIVPMGIYVTLIEHNREKAAKLSEELPQVNVLCGDGTSQELLEQEGLTDMNAFVCLTDRDEENLMTGLYAAKQGVGKVIVKNNRLNYLDIIADLGLDTVISPRQITSAGILRYVRALAGSAGTKVEKLFRLMNGRAEALEFIVREGAPYLGKPLKELTLRKNTLVAMITRKNKVIVPGGNDHLEAGDSVVIMAGERGISDLSEVIIK